jgi:RHS repeat-associated protein
MAGRMTSRLLPEETATETFGWDSQKVGGLHTYTDARGITTTFTLDNMYRPTSIAFSDGTPTVTNAYDLATQTNSVGLLSTTSTSNTITGFNYDVMGRMTLKGEQGPLLFGVGNTTIGYAYDFGGNVLSLADSASNNTLTYTRNPIGQLTGITASYAGVSGDVVPTVIAGATEFGGPWAYNAFGSPTSASGAAGYRTFTYDKMDRVLSMGDGGVGYYTWGVARDTDGKVTAVDDQILGNWTYGYDNNIAGGRLTSATCTGGCANGYGTASWTYDEYGNRWTQTASKGLNTLFTYDTGAGGAMHNRLTSGQGATYDAAGDMLTDTIPNTYTYDALHRVSTFSANSSSFVYDGLGNRVEDHNANGTFDFYFDGSRRLHFDTSATVKGLGMKAGYGEYHGAPGAMQYFDDFRDQVGTLRQQSLITAVSGGVASSWGSAQTYVSLPFGDSYLDTNQGGADTDLMSKTFFANTMQIGGVNFSENRAQNVQTGGWLTPDPAHQGWNAYVYVDNNPVTFADPLGLYCTVPINGPAGVHGPGCSYSTVGPCFMCGGTGGGGGGYGGEPGPGGPSGGPFGPTFGAPVSGGVGGFAGSAGCGSDFLPCGPPPTTGLVLPCDLGNCGPQIGSDYTNPNPSGQGTSDSPYTFYTLVSLPFLIDPAAMWEIDSRGLFNSQLLNFFGIKHYYFYNTASGEAVGLGPKGWETDETQGDPEIVFSEQQSRCIDSKLENRGAPPDYSWPQGRENVFPAPTALNCFGYCMRVAHSCEFP